MKQTIKCTPAECVKLRTKRTPAELAWAEEVMAYYACKPKKGNDEALTIFVADVFAAGRISGKREERRRRKHTGSVLSPVKADIVKCLGKISDTDAQLIATVVYECMRK